MKKMLIPLLFILLLACANAEEYYADITADISLSGETKISGTTNHLLLSPSITQKYTSKNGEMWIFELNINDVFSNYIYEIILPQGSEIEKVQTPGDYRVTTRGDRIAIISTAENKPFSVRIEYMINPQKNIDYTWVIVLAVCGIIGAGIIIYFLKMKKKPKTENKKYDIDALTERQVAIVKLIESSGGKITQSQIQKTLNYPKAALSRNLEALIKKEIIEKERKGMTMLVKIKTPLQKEKEDRKNQTN
jgi:uncharacterized membrane protein